jgi:hypothetical protein
MREKDWRDSRAVCALSDSDRHLGHIVFNRSHWNAFDATHLDESRTGFRYLGAFQTAHSAKAAVEASVAPAETVSHVSGMWRS